MKGKCSIICPLFKADEYIKPLFKSLQKQKGVDILEMIFVLTESGNGEEKILADLVKDNKIIKYNVIKKKEFSHSITREKAAFGAKGDVIVFVTQDIEIKSDSFLRNLVSPILDGEVDACYARQKSKYNNIEKYTREFNYPKKSFVVSKDDVERLGLKTFFFSDAASAISRKKFVELGGYDGKDLPISEDMYFAYKLIMAGGKIKYCADAEVFHSHRFTIKQIYERYKLTGEFFKQNKYLDKYGTNGSGAALAKYVLKRIFEEKRFGLLLRYPFDMGARFVGMKVGKR